MATRAFVGKVMNYRGLVRRNIRADEAHLVVEWQVFNISLD